MTPPEKSQSFRRFCRVLCLLLVLAVPGFARSQSGEVQKPPASERQSVGLPEVNVIDKLLAIEIALAQTLGRSKEDDWAQDYRELYQKYKEDGNPGFIEPKGRAALALALGVKASDGVLALKGRDVEALNDCAEQIEKLALRLGVDQEYLGKAYNVKHHANQGQWLEAFMFLGYLQHEVIRKLDTEPENKEDAVLVVMGGWLQAGRCVTDIILKHYTPDLSNTIREPKILQLMIAEMNKLDDAVKQDPYVQKLMAFLPKALEIVNVGLREPVFPREKVQELHDQFDALVNDIMSPAP
jgi:hypothetical protein